MDEDRRAFTAEWGMGICDRIWRGEPVRRQLVAMSNLRNARIGQMRGALGRSKHDASTRTSAILKRDSWHEAVSTSTVLRFRSDAFSGGAGLY